VKKGVSAIVPDYKSDMPGFEQVRAVLDFIKSTWPEREREPQARRSRRQIARRRTTVHQRWAISIASTKSP
jgi:hypothetical protein